MAALGTHGLWHCHPAATVAHGNTRRGQRHAVANHSQETRVGGGAHSNQGTPQGGRRPRSEGAQRAVPGRCGGGWGGVGSAERPRPPPARARQRLGSVVTTRCSRDHLWPTGHMLLTSWAPTAWAGHTCAHIHAHMHTCVQSTRTAHKHRRTDTSHQHGHPMARTRVAAPALSPPGLPLPLFWALARAGLLGSPCLVQLGGATGCLALGDGAGPHGGG